MTFLCPTPLSLTQSDFSCRHSYGSNEPFTLLYLSAAIHLPFSICCSLFIGISEDVRNMWRGLDVFFIFTCAGMPCLHPCLGAIGSRLLLISGSLELSRLPVGACHLQCATLEDRAVSDGDVRQICKLASWLPTCSAWHAVLRGSGIAWHVFSTRGWNLYMAALLLDWAFCLVRVMRRRRIRHIPRKELVWDIAGICTGNATSLCL